jgi:hypothetical protein
MVLHPMTKGEVAEISLDVIATNTSILSDNQQGLILGPS